MSTNLTIAIVLNGQGYEYVLPDTAFVVDMISNVTKSTEETINVSRIGEDLVIVFDSETFKQISNTCLVDSILNVLKLNLPSVKFDISCTFEVAYPMNAETTEIAHKEVDFIHILREKGKDIIDTISSNSVITKMYLSEHPNPKPDKLQTKTPVSAEIPEDLPESDEDEDVSENDVSGISDNTVFSVAQKFKTLLDTFGVGGDDSDDDEDDDEDDDPKPKKNGKNKSSKKQKREIQSSRVIKASKNPKKDYKNHGILVTKHKDALKRDEETIKRFLKEFIPGDGWRRDFRDDLCKRWMKMYAVSNKKMKSLESEHRKKKKKVGINKDRAIDITRRLFSTTMDNWSNPNK